MEINGAQENRSVRLNEVPKFKKKWTSPDIEIISRDIIAGGGIKTTTRESSAPISLKHNYHS